MSKHGQNHTVFDVVVGPTCRAKENIYIFSLTHHGFIFHKFLYFLHIWFTLKIDSKQFDDHCYHMQKFVCFCSWAKVRKAIGLIFGNQCFKLCGN